MFLQILDFVTNAQIRQCANRYHGNKGEKKEQMKRALKIVQTSLVLLVLLPYLVTCQTQQAQIEEAVKLTDNCIELLKHNELEQIAYLFHFPPEYNEQQIQDDIKDIQEWVVGLKKEFGTLVNAKRLNEPAQYIDLSIGGGNIPYWERHPEFINVVYKASFQKEKDGFIIFWVVDISKKLELKTIGYGLPANDPLARERIMEIGEKMMQSFIKKHKKVDELKLGHRGTPFIFLYLQDTRHLI